MAPSKKPCVLYIDDEHANRLVFERAFERDFEIQLAETAEQGLKIMETTPVALVVTDQRLPGMFGTELLKIAKERFPNIVRMILTAYSDIDVVLRAINEGLASRYIIKPWVRPMLHEVLTWGCDMHRMKVQVEDLQLKLVEGERLSTMGTLLASVAHDIKNPLGYMAAYVETLSDTASALQGWVAEIRTDTSLQAAFRTPHAEQALSEIEELPRISHDLNQGISHITSIVDGIQLNSRRPARARKPADPAIALDYAMKLAKGMVSARGGILTLEAGTLPSILLSTSELSQVLVNLLINAAHAVSQVTNGPRQVRIVVNVIENGVRFEVIDTGIGMAPDVLEKACEEFFTTKSLGEGTGLGLPISKRVVESVGGTFQIESTVGKGTQVRFWVPQSSALATE